MNELRYKILFESVAKFRNFFYESSETLELALAILVLKHGYLVYQERDPEFEDERGLPNIKNMLDSNFFSGDPEHFFLFIKSFSKKIDLLFFESETDLAEVLEGFVLKGGSKDGVLILLRDLFKEVMSRDDLSKKTIPDLFELELKELYESRGLVGSEFYTPRDVVDFMVSAVAPVAGERIYDPVCGSAGFLVGAEMFSLANSPEKGRLALYGVDKFAAVARLAKWNLFVHGCYDSSITVGDSLTKHSERRFDVILANPPFSVKTWDWSAFEYGGRAIYGQPPKSNADYAFLQHIISSLNDSGRAAVIVPSGVLFRGGVEKEIRAEIVKDGLIEAVVFLPSGIFKNTNVSSCVLFIDKRQRHNSIFFVKSSGKVHGEKGEDLVVNELQLLLKTYQGRKEVPGLSRIVAFQEIADNDYDLNFFRYVQAEEVGGRPLADVFSEYSQLEDKLRSLQDEMASFVKKIL